jgi:hypothetical protein
MGSGAARGQRTDRGFTNAFAVAGTAASSGWLTSAGMTTDVDDVA